jgi:hypothetical protein
LLKQKQTLQLLITSVALSDFFHFTRR